MWRNAVRSNVVGVSLFVFLSQFFSEQGLAQSGPGRPMLDPDPVDSTFVDTNLTLTTPHVELGYLAPCGDAMKLLPADRLVPFQVTTAELPIPGETLLVIGGRTYLEFRIGRLVIRVINSRSPVFGPGFPPADVTFDIGREPVENVQLNEIFTVPTGATEEKPVNLKTVQVVPQAGGSPLQQQDLNLVDPSFNTCKGQAIHRFAQGAYQDKIPYDMPLVKFPPISDCSKDECIEIYTAWMRAHHNIWRARQLIEVVASLPYHEQRIYAWGRPGRDFQGEKVTERTAPSHWFGGYDSDRFGDIRTVINKLWDRYTKNKVGTLNLDLRCPTSGANVCATTEGVIAHHIVAGRVDVCDFFFDLGGQCYGGTWNAETEECEGGFIVSEAWRQAEVMAHEVLHHTSVSGLIVQDKHTHGHGNSCAGSINILQSMYEYDNVRHLATYNAPDGGTCLHRERARHNNDNYGFFITTIGDMVYRGQMATWPAWGDPTPQPPGDCDVGEENCYCLETQPFGEGSVPDGDHRDDLYCEDNDGEMTCQRTKFNASSTEGICTKCDTFRGAGCECDDDRPCDAGSCWGDTTFGNAVGRCYNFPPPDWACLADCKKLYNDDNAWCYFNHPGGVARCMDSLCSAPEEDVCNSQGKVCRYGDCFDECVLTSDCVHNPQSQENLGYPEYFVCSHQGFSRCEPVVGNAQQAQQAPGFAAFNFGLGVTPTFLIKADANADKMVDKSDLNVWRENFGTSQGAACLANGDFDGDSDVDGNDFLVWQRNLGPTTGPVVTEANDTATEAAAVRSPEVSPQEVRENENREVTAANEASLVFADNDASNAQPHASGCTTSTLPTNPLAFLVAVALLFFRRHKFPGRFDCRR